MLMRVAVGIHKHDIEAAIQVSLDFLPHSLFLYPSFPPSLFPSHLPLLLHNTHNHIYSPPPLPLQSYNLMSERWFTHASPTLFNAGTCRPQLSSCFLVCMKDDSIEVRGHVTSPSKFDLLLHH